MGRLPRLVLGLGALLGALGMVHCDDDDELVPVCRPGQPCVCRAPQGESVCSLDCTKIDGCTPVCGSADVCDVRCGTNCLFECADLTECVVSAGEGGVVRCSRVGNCRATVGPNSTVDCSNLGQCAVTCAGPCQIRTASIGGQTLVCGSTGGPPLDCGGGRYVCDSAC